MTARTCAVVALLVFAVTGCRKKSTNESAESALSKMQAFASAMCRCTERSCADLVQAQMTQWLTERANDPGADERPSESVMKGMTEFGQKYAECMTAAMAGGPGSAAAGSGSVDAGGGTRPPPAMKLSTPSDRPSIGRLLQEAKEYTRAAEDDLVIHVLRARYVAPDGELDPTYGELLIGFGNRLPGAPRIEDDPERPTGAPIPEPTASPPPKRSDTASCPEATWTQKTGWSWGERSCFAQSALNPTCSLAEVWKRAQRVKGAETKSKAVAIIELVRNDDNTQSWEFSIRDGLRNVDINARVPDRCTPILEKP